MARTTDAVRVGTDRRTCAAAAWRRLGPLWGLVLWAIALLSGNAGAEPDGELMSVEVPVANFRAGPSTDDDILFTATEYFPVRVLEKEDGWARIRDFEDEEAWIATRLLTRVPTVVIEVDEGNVRAEPTTRADKIDEVVYGEVFRIVKREGRWLRVATPNEVIGWVRNDLTWGEKSMPPEASGSG